MSARLLTIPALTLATSLTTACADDTEIEPICKYIDNPSDCMNPNGDTGGDEPGDPERDPYADDIDPCTLNADGTPRTVMQCNGSLSASIAFKTFLGDCANTLGDPGWCDESHDFGLGVESYEMPAVMACCDPSTASEDEVLRHCSVDMIEQICRSIPKRLQMLISKGVIKVGKGQARALRAWLDGHQQDCFEAFNVQGETPGVIEPRSWLINGGDNERWPALDNFTITIDAAAVISTTVPEDEADWLACDDAEYNNTEIFEEVMPVSPGISDVTQLAAATHASVSGPVVFGNRVVGAASLAASATCMQPRCSTLALREDPSAGVWMLEELSLFADLSVTLASGELELEVERAALRLFGVSEGKIRSGAGVEDSYVIQPGNAYFLISGSSRGTGDSRWATNSTAIIARKSAAGWELDRFAVEHVDGVDQSWVVTIPSTTWD